MVVADDLARDAEKLAIADAVGATAKLVREDPQERVSALRLAAVV
jgi:hypothetical protein